MTTISIPAMAAGLFYAEDACQLRCAVSRYLQEAVPLSKCHPQAIIAPHAGYDYSGPVAGAAYAALQSAELRSPLVGLFGTCHLPGASGLITTSARSMATPLGEVAVDQDAVHGVLERFPECVSIDNMAHGRDHALQVQLPFLQISLEDVAVVPFLVGAADSDEIADVMAGVLDFRDAAIVVSSDLSHHLDYDTARRMDRQTVDAIVELDASVIGREQACGFWAIRGLLTLARRRGWTARVLDLQNSGDTAGDRSRVVGYGAILFVAPDESP